MKFTIFFTVLLAVFGLSFGQSMKVYPKGNSTPASYSIDAIDSITFELAQATMPSSLLIPRYGFGIGQIGDIIYCVGGKSNPSGTVIGTIEAINVKTGVADTSFAHLPTPRFNLEVAVVNNKLYAIGGRTAVGGAYQTKIVEVYNPSTNTWATKMAMNTIRRDFGTAVISGKIYAIAGWSDNDTYTNTCEVYDTSLNTWTAISSLDQDYADQGVVTYQGKIYLFGGNTGGYPATVPTKDIQVYDPTTNIWTRAPQQLSVNQSVFGQAMIGSKIYIFGGAGTLQQIQSLDLSNMTSQIERNLVIGRIVSEAITIGSTIYILGGNDASNNSTGSIEMFP